MGVWDVAMNVEGADVERSLDRALMPRLHGMFSIGSVVGAGVGALSAAVDIPLAVQVLVIAVCCAGVDGVAPCAASCRRRRPSPARSARAEPGP